MSYGMTTIVVILAKSPIRHASSIPVFSSHRALSVILRKHGKQAEIGTVIQAE